MEFVYQFSNAPKLFKEICELQNEVDKNFDKRWQKNLPTKDKNI